MNPVLAVALVVAILGVMRPTEKVRGPHHHLLTAEKDDRTIELTGTPKEKKRVQQPEWMDSKICKSNII